MKRNLDIILGLTAWLMAIVTRVWLYASYSAIPVVMGRLILPTLWLWCVVPMLINRQHRVRRTWWVWLSVPYAFCFWLQSFTGWVELESWPWYLRILLPF